MAERFLKNHPVETTLELATKPVPALYQDKLSGIAPLIAHLRAGLYRNWSGTAVGVQPSPDFYLECWAPAFLYSGGD